MSFHIRWVRGSRGRLYGGRRLRGRGGGQVRTVYSQDQTKIDSGVLQSTPSWRLAQAKAGEASVDDGTRGGLSLSDGDLSWVKPTLPAQHPAQRSNRNKLN